MNNSISILSLIIGAGVGALIVFLIFMIRNSHSENKAEKLMKEAKKEAEKYKRDSILELKEESFKLKQETDKEIKEKKSEILSSAERLMQWEKSLDKRSEMIHYRTYLFAKKDKIVNFLP